MGPRIVFVGLGEQTQRPQAEGLKSNLWRGSWKLHMSVHPRANRGAGGAPWGHAILPWRHSRRKARREPTEAPPYDSDGCGSEVGIRPDVGTPEDSDGRNSEV